ncbi:hypothetical protein ROZALSC1DRAFT_28597 [Rozella allomycis CSF55]|nr:hypothetical protein ROZALSC1DRAFT_28597 [Rozella allomycis CSF55]
MSLMLVAKFTEKCKALGYTQHLSVNSFKTPNFNQMAILLKWLITNIDPHNDIEINNIDTEAGRIQFVRNVTLLAATKLNIKLNSRKLYMADINAMQEMAKLVDFLYAAMDEALGIIDHNPESSYHDIDYKIDKIIHGRQISLEITKLGTILDDSIDREVECRMKRSEALSQTIDSIDIQKAVESAISDVDNQTRVYRQKIEQTKSDIANLNAKLEKKKADIERFQKRLNSLQGVRPPFMDEFEKLEGDLKALYGNYVGKFRHLQYLEHEMQMMQTIEQEKLQEYEMNRQQFQLNAKEEELLYLRGDLDGDEKDDELDDLNSDELPVSDKDEPVEKNLDSEEENYEEPDSDEELRIASAATKRFHRPQAASGRRGSRSAVDKGEVDSEYDNDPILEFQGHANGQESELDDDDEIDFGENDSQSQ